MKDKQRLHKDTFTVTEEDTKGERVDVFLSQKLNLISRSQLKARITDIKVNGRDVKISKKILPGDIIEVSYSDPVPLSAEPQEIPFALLYEDDNVIVINKPSGLVVHPAPGTRDGTLVNGLLYRFRDMERVFEEESLRPGIVHRLDKDTSGVLIAAKNPHTHEFLARQFRKKQTRKTYVLIVKNRPNPLKGIIAANIRRDPNRRKRFIHCRTGGKTAVTEYKTLMSRDDYSFVTAKPQTGRTHQLRVHFSSIGCPILGDPVYSRKDKDYPDARLMLHAYTLEIYIPGNPEKQRFRAPLPEDMKLMLTAISKNQ